MYQFPLSQSLCKGNWSKHVSVQTTDWESAVFPCFSHSDDSTRHTRSYAENMQLVNTAAINNA